MYVYSYLLQDKFCERREVCVSNSKSMVLRVVHVCVCREEKFVYQYRVPLNFVYGGKSPV